MCCAARVCHKGLKGLGHEKIEGRYFLILHNILQDTDGKSIDFRQNACVSGMLKKYKTTEKVVM